MSQESASEISAGATLGDLGERAIIREILHPRYDDASHDYGNDCASIRWPSANGWLIATTDPCPPPAAWALGYTDFYYYGWLLATINLSDLAAAGADPLGLLTNLQLPASTTLSDFLRLLDGVDDCCQSVGTTVVGGNLKEASTLDASATALGVCATQPMARTGAVPGDDVYTIGRLGAFWAAYVGETRYPSPCADVLEDLRSTVLTPTPLIGAGIRLRESGFATSCMDNSDGLLPTARLLAEASSVAITLDVDRFVPSAGVVTVADVAGIDWWRFALGWGDWNLVFTASPDRKDEISEIGLDSGAAVSPIGKVESGSGLRIRSDGKVGRPTRLESERFAKDSWFQHGLDSYIEALLQNPVIAASAS